MQLQGWCRYLKQKEVEVGTRLGDLLTMGDSRSEDQGPSPTQGVWKVLETREQVTL